MAARVVVGFGHSECACSEDHQDLDEEEQADDEKMAQGAVAGGRRRKLVRLGCMGKAAVGAEKGKVALLAWYKQRKEFGIHLNTRQSGLTAQR